MGNTESNVTSGVKKQAGASLQPIYKLCDLKVKYFEQMFIHIFVSKKIKCFLIYRRWFIGRIDETSCTK